MGKARERASSFVTRLTGILENATAPIHPISTKIHHVLTHPAYMR